MATLLNLNPAEQGKTLRPHQEEALFPLRQSAVRGTRCIVFQAPTGGGKTPIAARIIEDTLAKGNKVIFAAPGVSLIDHTVGTFKAEGIRDICVIQANHCRTDPLARVEIAYVRTLARREIPEAAIYVDAVIDNTEREPIERRFGDGKIKVVWYVRTLITGVDWPVSCVIDAALNQSKMLHVQKIGRGNKANLAKTEKQNVYSMYLWGALSAVARKTGG